MTWTPDDMPDLSGRTAIVTGGNGGLGLETVRELARHGAHVVMAARNLDKARTALIDVDGSVEDASVEIQSLDLASLDSVERFADAVADAHERIDILVNNAGVMATPAGTTEDGFETQFGINHLGHHAVTARLLPQLLAADEARIVTVTSFARLSGPDLTREHLRPGSDYDPWAIYGLSKRANYHFALGLQQRLSDAGASAISLAAHPGFTNSDLQARTVRSGNDGLYARFWRSAVRLAGMEVERGAHPQLRAATDPDAEGGELHGPLTGINGPAVRKPILTRPDQQDIDLLFELSEEATGLALDAGAIAAAAQR